jgi:hypothetical protein
MTVLGRGVRKGGHYMRAMRAEKLRLAVRGNSLVNDAKLAGRRVFMEMGNVTGIASKIEALFFLGINPRGLPPRQWPP